MKLFLKILFFIFTMLITTVEEAKSSTVVDIRIKEALYFQDSEFIVAVSESHFGNPCLDGKNAVTYSKRGISFYARAAKTGSSWVYGAFKSEAKWAGQLSKRGWTAEQITEAVTKGKSFDAVNMVNKANSATRYVHPTTGQSVVIDNVTKELLHVGGPGFKY